LEFKLSLPDRLAKEAQEAGLLSPQAIEAMVRETLRTRRVDEFFGAMHRMTPVDHAPMTEKEIDAARAERRARPS
jgi:hypothetical protein